MSISNSTSSPDISRNVQSERQYDHHKIMFKTKLQEYCHSKAWLLPGYAVTREGADHCPRFKAVVEVNGFSFASPDICTNTKEAQNLAAKLAFQHFTGHSNMSMAMTSAPVSSTAQLPETVQISPTASCNREDGIHMYKHQLQIYTQKRNLDLPVYSVERVGPCHASCFKCKVTVEDITYDGEDYFQTVKEAESAAAKVALASIFPGGFEELQDDPAIYKNLLQEFLQKNKEMSCHPIYTTTREGPPHMPLFVSTVEILKETFRGQEAKTKKQAEMYAAKVAYITLRERIFKKDDNLNAVQDHVKKALQLSSADVPEGGSDAQPMFNTQFECNLDKGTKATCNSFTGIVDLKATQSENPISWSNDPSSSSSSKPVNGLIKEKATKKKIIVLPRASTRSYPDAPVRHSDEKWIAFTKSS